jgi:hypothetical protein
LKKIAVIQAIMIVIEVILLVISIIAYNYIYNVEVGKQNYAEESEKFVEENEEPVFKVGKIILYSGVNVVDNSENEELQDLNVSQFTDIEIFIDNKTKISDITAENTINEMYIDNIKVSSNSENEEKIFNYKNPNYCGKYVDLENYRDDGILFKIINTNAKNSSANYDENAFYTDCSNPISLGYINKNILTNASVSNTGSISFDGSILKIANISLDDLDTTISFSIHIKNNYNEEFVCNVKLDNFFKDDTSENKTIYDGYIMKVINANDEFNFLKVSNR